MYPLSILVWLCTCVVVYMCGCVHVWSCTCVVVYMCIVVHDDVEFDVIFLTSLCD